MFHASREHLRQAAIETTEPRSLFSARALIQGILALSLVISVLGTNTASADSLRTAAAQALAAARTSMLQESAPHVDVIWGIQRILRLHADPELQQWVDAKAPLLANDPFYPAIAPAPLTPLPNDPGTGLVKFSNYVLASVGTPDSTTHDFLTAYFSTQEAGYVLTHQLLALGFAELVGRTLPTSLTDMRPQFLEQITTEHANDPIFSDLYAERAAFLLVFAEPDPIEVAGWIQIILDAQVADGDWGTLSWEATYDGETGEVTDNPRHTQFLAMVALTYYLDLPVVRVPLLNGPCVILLAVLLGITGLLSRKTRLPIVHRNQG